ncbi:glycoside hydrolase superfamily [Kockovaella imperatae]|uniref:Beta-mannosidase A n=1 Tax=Kockovaella imperatae TaxID=4999 RepID=A0A1Y1UE66_9TREE|nr:glycoside hydrolase superfamily [Kockovaella imperatae]ORX36312.1 glycoside hydrolase superfamily [Kockovaella imperatae]
MGGSVSVFSLNGDQWTLTSPGNDSFQSIPAHVPSQNYIDLHNAGVTEDVLYGYQEDDQHWVQYSNWSYNHNGLTLNKSSQLTTHLVFEGLDTFTTIYFCDQEVVTTNNQYLQYIVDVTSLSQSCSQSPVPFSINFGPAYNISIEQGLQGDPNIKFADGCEASGTPPTCREFIRKEQSDQGWDWSPNISPAGPWRNISLVQLDTSVPGSIYVNNAAIDIYRQGQMNNLPPDQTQNWVFNASLDYFGSLPTGSGLSLNLTDQSGNVVASTALSGITTNGQTITGSTVIPASSVQLWWPNGMGAQTLYQAAISVTPPSGVSTFHPTVVERQVGFRTIVLNGETVSAADQAKGIAGGNNWHFEINGETMYAKGAALVPLNALWANVNQTYAEQLFELAVQANFNMLRIWSSGVYVDDYIYTLADQMGLLMWSEFQFSDGAYQGDAASLAMYEAEAYYNIRRINYHPSLAVWVGGNELEADELQFWGGNPGIFDQYIAIQEQLLIKCVYANTRGISYIPSSLYNGYIALDFDSVTPQTPRYHNYTSPTYYYNDTEGYLGSASQAFQPNQYGSTRFMVEFGWNSFPTADVLDNIGENIDSCYDPVIIYHNRHEGAFFGQVLPPVENSIKGIDQELSGQVMFYPVPEIEDPAANFTAWIYGSQVFQADIISDQIALYRRDSSQPQRNLGTLIWMFNDVWIAPTWSAVTANLKSKTLLYSAMDIYSPVIVRSYYDQTQDNLQVWVTSDQFFPVTGQVTFQWMDWSGENITAPVPYNCDNTPVTIGAVNSTKVYDLPSAMQTFIKPKVDPSTVVARLSTTVSGNGQTFTHESWYHPVPLNNATLADPQLTLAKGSNSNTFTVSAPSAVAVWVVLDFDSHLVSGYFSDNGFWLAKGESKTVSFTVWNDWTGDGSWQSSVTVRSMYDNVANRQYAATLG